MGLITGNEPAHWHTEREDGTLRHNMKDPRAIPGWKPAYWTEDERAYVEHLEKHESYIGENPQPSPNDPPLITTMFEAIDANERSITKYRNVITGIRQALAAGKTMDEVHEMFRPVQEGESEQSSDEATAVER